MTLNDIGREVHDTNKANGFEVLSPCDWENDYKIPAMLSLVTTETSEAVEAFRVNDRENFGEELADQILRILGIASGLGIDMDMQVIWKLAKNKTRKHKHGGKRI